jgi:hypothetical protein
MVIDMWLTISPMQWGCGSGLFAFVCIADEPRMNDGDSCIVFFAHSFLAFKMWEITPNELQEAFLFTLLVLKRA